MGLFDVFKKKTGPESDKGPYRNPALNKIYNLLFCDNIHLYQFDNAAAVYPWNILLSQQPDITSLKAITKDRALETRARIIAHKTLRSLGVPAEEKELLAVIIEVGLEKGLDTLAAYRDGTARLLHHSESVLVWDTQTPLSTQLIDQLFIPSMNVITEIGPSTQPRKPRPDFSMVRLTFIASDGVYVGEGSFNKLEKDNKLGSVIYSATRLMSFLIQQKGTPGR